MGACLILTVYSRVQAIAATMHEPTNSREKSALLAASRCKQAGDVSQQSPTLVVCNSVYTSMPCFQSPLPVRLTALILPAIGVGGTDLATSIGSRQGHHAGHLAIASVVMFACHLVQRQPASRVFKATLRFLLIAVFVGWFAEQMGSLRDGWFFGSYTLHRRAGPAASWAMYRWSFRMMWFVADLLVLRDQPTSSSGSRPVDSTPRLGQATWCSCRSLPP